MKQQFETYIHTRHLLTPQSHVLLAISGGADSMVMLHLFEQLNYPIAIAHCNFQLRGNDALRDEEFVLQYAHTHHIPIHNIRFNTTEYCQQHNISIEMGARQLRYEWFDLLIHQYHYTCLATAHHMDDSLETFFLNAIRKTGISGLHGILPQSGYIIRPMLFCTKKDILQYAHTHHLNYMEDYTNNEDDVQRNFIRLHIIPLFEQLRPDFKPNLNATTRILHEQELIYNQHINSIKQRIIHQQGDNYIIPIADLTSLHPTTTYVYECIRSYGFNYSQAENITRSLPLNEEKTFASTTFILTKTRTQLLIQPLSTLLSPNYITTPITDISALQAMGIQAELVPHTPDFTFENNKNTAYFDYDQIQFPLAIRSWQQGDYFYPIHGKGKKKISDFFTNIKLNNSQKHQARLLLHANNDILWIIGYRSDNRYAVTAHTHTILILRIL